MIPTRIMSLPSLSSYTPGLPPNQSHLGFECHLREQQTPLLVTSRRTIPNVEHPTHVNWCQRSEVYRIR